MRRRSLRRRSGTGLVQRAWLDSFCSLRRRGVRSASKTAASSASPSRGSREKDTNKDHLLAAGALQGIRKGPTCKGGSRLRRSMRVITQERESLRIPIRRPAAAVADPHVRLPYRPDVDGLRALAVVAVVVY